ncbi:MAG TPA: hypothetical protein VMS35_06530 [Nitrososphaeraceae archaeon]|nr:hypothetical protein [Nitrososphaeraceae archaeon]
MKYIKLLLSVKDADILYWNLDSLVNSGVEQNADVLEKITKRLSSVIAKQRR